MVIPLLTNQDLTPMLGAATSDVKSLFADYIASKHCSIMNEIHSALNYILCKATSAIVFKIS